MNTLDAQLLLAAREGQATAVEGLIAAGANPNAVDPGSDDHGNFYVGLTPLMVAAASPRSNAATVRALLLGGADPSLVSAGGVTATWYAAGGTGYRYDPAEHAGNPTLEHFGGGDADRLRLLLDATNRPDEFADNGRSLVLEAASVGDPASLQVLIERGASVWPVVGGRLSADARTAGRASPLGVPLYVAAASGDVECVRLILAAGVPANILCSDHDALFYAGNPEVAQVLWAAGARPTGRSFGFDALDEAIEEDRIEVLSWLVRRSSERDRQSVVNAKLMTAAGVRMNAKAVRALLALGADPNFRDTGLGTPVHWAAWQGDSYAGRENSVVEETLVALIEAGADVNLNLPERGTPLHEAVEGDWDSPTSVRVLLAYGAQVDPVDAQGNTPLHRAVERRAVECVRLLLAAGADRNVTNRLRQTPLSLARAQARPSWVGRAVSKRILGDFHGQYMEMAKDILAMLEG